MTADVDIEYLSLKDNWALSLPDGQACVFTAKLGQEHGLACLIQSGYDPSTAKKSFTLCMKCCIQPVLYTTK
jgi:hypothetical protein